MHNRRPFSLPALLRLRESARRLAALKARRDLWAKLAEALANAATRVDKLRCGYERFELLVPEDLFRAVRRAAKRAKVSVTAWLLLRAARSRRLRLRWCHERPRGRVPGPATVIGAGRANPGGECD